jgi:hypothetical protein
LGSIKIAIGAEITEQSMNAIGYGLISFCPVEVQDELTVYG